MSMLHDSLKGPPVIQRLTVFASKLGTQAFLRHSRFTTLHKLFQSHSVEAMRAPA
jgi:hypothetical protein